MEENKSEAILDELSTSLSGKIKIINDVEKYPMKGYYIEDEEVEDLSEDDLLSQMGYTKTEPKINKLKEPEKRFSDDEEDENKNDSLEKSILVQMDYLKKEPPKHEPNTMPTADLNLVSALKGTRKKEGTSDKDRRVSWAPDVYDPYPTYSEFLVKAKDGAGKNRQKGGGQNWGASDGEGNMGKGKKSGRSKKGVEKGKMGGKDKKGKKHGDKKHGKKRGGSSGGSKYSEFGDF
ncbi:hypothetical protein CASFOL_039420 [Castilleja foliolosa]|uniref:Uncharacterized protein n=1 Tax=Castilleja foliolosa TaxID=1961234 RepID=A0ABD3BIX0_9LAMI